MENQQIALTDGNAEGFVIPLGPVNLVLARTARGMVGCGAFNVNALDRFSYPAATVGASDGGTIASVDDLLKGIVRDTNVGAVQLGVQVGMSGREALELM